MTITAAVKSFCSTTNCTSMCTTDAMMRNWLNRSSIRQFKSQNLLNCQNLHWLDL